MRALTLAFLMVASRATLALDYVACVDSEGDLAAAMTAATAPYLVYDNVIIRVEQGVYNLTSSELLGSDYSDFLTVRRPLQLLGGYSDNCVSRQLDPGNTAFVNSGDKQLHWKLLHDFRLQGFNFSGFDNNISFDNFVIEDTQQRLDISHNRFVGGTGHVQFGADAGAGTSLITLKNNVFFGRDAGAGCVLVLRGDSLSGTVRAVVANNTLAGNSGADALCLFDVDTPSFYNNIFFTNGGDDISGDLSNGPAVAIDNIYQSTSHLPGFLVNTGNHAGNPQFVDYPAGDLTLQGSSPAVNQGTNNVPYGTGNVDAGGLPRVVGTAIDRGAHESSSSGLFVLTVTNTNDSGTGSLREAISQANATPGLNGIHFNIPGSGCPKVIELSSALPPVSESLVIDGGTQPGSVPNNSDFGFDGVRCILLRGQASEPGLRVSSAASAGTQLVVDSLAFGGFSFSVLLQGGNGHILKGNHFGVSLGSSSNAGTVGVFVADADAVQIGGAGADDRNVFARQTSAGLITGAGIVIGAESQHIEVSNNYFGTEANGVTPAGNSYAIVTDGDDGLFTDNLIANSTESGIRLRGDASGNEVIFSRLGLPAFCLGDCPSSSHNTRGVLVEGDGNGISANQIASDEVGVRVTGDDNRITYNAVFGGSLLFAPIDIAGGGFSANDNDVLLQPGGNRGLNYPVITDAVTSQDDGANTVLVTGTLESRNGTYQVHLYASDRRLSLVLGQGYRCEAAQYLGYQSDVTISDATAGANGSAAFAINVPADLVEGRYLTAQAIRVSVPPGTGQGDSSELGGCHPAPEAPMFRDGFE